jgi:exopolyphosphatase / guanosine-5'-triphosphate,3'-diphosphate pyrophosphatase
MTDLKASAVIAAIDVGSSAIRMEIAEVRPDGTFSALERLSRAAELGKDTFANGHLSEERIQVSCQILTDFARVMREYGVTRYRAVATSAVREASNADTLVDRAFLRAGIDVEVIDGSEENRLMYMAIRDAVRRVDLADRNVLVVEVGGGSTDISFLEKSEPLHSGTFALGAVRMRQSMQGVKADLKQRRKLIDRQIKNTLDTIANTIPFAEAQEMMALGGDIRLAARQITKSESQDFWVLDRKELKKFCDEIIRYDIDQLVRNYGLTYPEAETFAEALLVYSHIAERTKAERIHVFSVNIRAGLVLDMVARELGKGLKDFEEQILSSARALARKYNANVNHMEQVRGLALKLFEALAGEHGLDVKERILLEVAALLHDVGSFISDRSHHKHTQYIITASEIFGLSRDDLNLVANIARYHRKSPPSRSHLGYVALDRDSRMMVSKLAAILRIADALDQDYSNKVKNLKLIKDEDPDRFVLEVEADGDLAIESLSIQNKSDLFREIYGKSIIVRQVG